jgi:REase_DpnII-MboI
VSNSTELLLTDARSALERSLARRPQSELDLVYGYWLIRDSVSVAEAVGIAARMLQRRGAQQDFQTVASLGYSYAAELLRSGDRSTLKAGLERLAGRQPFVDEQPMAFCSDAVGILGVALGTRALGESELDGKLSSWMRQFLPKIYQLDGTEAWQRCLFQSADKILNGKVGLPSAIIEHAEDVYIAMVSKGAIGLDGAQIGARWEEEALRMTLAEGALDVPFERAAIRLACLQYISRSAPVVVPGRIDHKGLVHLLNRVPAGLRKWTWESTSRTGSSPIRRWEVDHEYHVQNMLCALLAPIFPDLDDEQFFKKVGQKGPRADFYIPSMSLVVEVKFVRERDTLQRVIDQIAADTALYRAAGNDCAGIIPFIWDNGGRSHEHDYLSHGLRKLSGIVDVVIVSRPTNWGRESTPKPRRRRAAPGGRRS